MVKRNYATKSKKYILEFLQKNIHTTVSAADILDYLAANGVEVNFTTVYRNLNRLEKEKKVIKITNQKGEKAVYQLAENTHACSEHIHIQCVKCGCLLHLDCDFMADITTHLKESHGFEINCESSTLYGLCEKCRE